MAQKFPDKKRTPSLLEDLDAFVDQSINTMFPQALREFEKKRKKIMSRLTRDVINPDVPREIEEQDQRVLQA